MKNAHLRIGKMIFSRTVGKSTGSFSLHLDRFIGERMPSDFPKAHFISVFGGDAQIAAAHAIISGEEPFQAEGPELERLTVNMGKNAKSYRSSIQLSSNKRPLRHLVAVSEEFGSQAVSQAKARTLLAGSSPEYIWASVAQIFGLPALPEWADWFYQKLKKNLSITDLYTVGLNPVLVTGTKEKFLRWLSSGIERGEITLPVQNGPSTWSKLELSSILLAPSAASDLSDSTQTLQ